MSLPPHREKDAKVEGRDPPESAKETMAPFRRLTKRLLKVTPDDVREQQLLYDQQRMSHHDDAIPKAPKKVSKKIKPVANAPIRTTRDSL